MSRASRGPRNSLLNLLWGVVAPVVVVVEGGAHHHRHAVEERGEFPQQGALEVVPDTCSSHREAAERQRRVNLFIQGFKVSGGDDGDGDLRLNSGNMGTRLLVTSESNCSSAVEFRSKQEQVIQVIVFTHQSVRQTVSQ